MDGLFLFESAARPHPEVEAWLAARDDALGQLTRQWFEALRALGPDVHELLHDGHPTACVGEAAFAYVDSFKAHVNVGFYRGAELPDPEGILLGSGKRMRHVKLRPGEDAPEGALRALVEAAYRDMRARRG